MIARARDFLMLAVAVCIALVAILVNAIDDSPVNP